MFGLKKGTKKVRRMKRVAKKVTGRRVKKRASVKAPKNLALSGAIRDLQSEISSLGREKSELKNAIQRASSGIDLDREQEKSLQQKIARLIEKEAKLNHKKKNLQTKIDRVSDKMNKISKIRSEMSDI